MNNIFIVIFLILCVSVSFLSVRTLEDEMIEITDVEATVTFTEGKWRWRDKVGV